MENQVLIGRPLDEKETSFLQGLERKYPHYVTYAGSGDESREDIYNQYGHLWDDETLAQIHPDDEVDNHGAFRIRLSDYGKAGLLELRLEKANAEIARLRGLMQSIASNAPLEEPQPHPTSPESDKRNYANAYSFWYAGQLIRKALDESPANQE